MTGEFLKMDSIKWQIYEPGIVFLPTTYYVIKHHLYPKNKNRTEEFILYWKEGIVHVSATLDGAKAYQKRHQKQMIELGYEI